MASVPANLIGHRCEVCAAEFPPESDHLVCPECGLDGILDVVLDHGVIAKSLTRETLAADRERSHWRYAAAMPLSDPSRRPALAVGGSPLIAAPRVASDLGLASLQIKDDGQNPTSSLKDRASSVGVAKAMEMGAKVITCSSTGNAASSLAGSAANLGMEAHIFVPARAPEAKVAQLQIFGAHVYVVQGTYEQAFDLSMACAGELGWYNRNSGINPVLVEGKKTVGWEIAEQSGWDPPDWIFASVGDGCSIYGLWKGLHEAHALGLSSHVPKLVGVQAAGAAPIVAAVESGRDLVPSEPDTLADSIAVGTPRNWRKAVRALAACDGRWMTVSDDEILEAMRTLGTSTGIFAEPAAAASFAGVRRAAREGWIGARDRVCAIVSGNGLKDVTNAVRAAGSARCVEPDADALLSELRGRV